MFNDEFFHALKGLKGSFGTIIMKQLFDEIHVCQQHPSATISLQSQLIQCLALSVICLQQGKIPIPLVARHTPTSEATNGNDHGRCSDQGPVHQTNKTMDHKQIAEIRESFNFLDINNDGYIDKHELRDTLASFGMQYFCKYSKA